MFKARTNADTKIQTIFDAPKVYITTNAYAKMTHIVDMVDKEVGWLGTAEWVKQSDMLVIDDIFLFHQEVNSSTCEITPEGLAEFAEELLQEDNGIDIWNNIKVWGHSHVNMGVSPSNQDDSQMKVFADHNDWFLRIIANKSGELKVDLFDYQANISYIDLKWDILIPELFSTKEFIENEIKKKVKEKKYNYTRSKYNTYIPPSTKNTSYTTLYFDVEAIFTEDEIVQIAECNSEENGIEMIRNILGNSYTQQEMKQLYNDCCEAYIDILAEEYQKYYEDMGGGME